MRQILLISVLLTAATVPAISSPINQPQTAAAEQLTIDRIFVDQAFKARSFGPASWTTKGHAYTRYLPVNEEGDAYGIFRIDPETGDRTLLVSPEQLNPTGQETPIKVESYHWSSMGDLLVFTNSKRVWRRNTRGDYWVLNHRTGKLKQLGTGLEPASLMFAKFSPDGTRVAYVYHHDLYVEDLNSGKRTRLTERSDQHIINGTFDWVYEEEFFLRDGFRWSPDGSAIAYWQLNTEGMREFIMINNTDHLYPEITTIPYPKAGTVNPAARVGVVPAAGGKTRWISFDGDPRQHYINHLEWTPKGMQLCIFRMPRSQQELVVYRADPATGSIETLLTETDDAWLEPEDLQLDWVNDGASWLWLSERDGWQHIYRYDAGKKEPVLLTPGDYDVIELLAVDEAEKRIYFIASPDDAASRYLYAVPLNGGPAQRLTPADQPGTHSYDISPDMTYAFHTRSRMMSPPVTDLVSLPDHRSIRMLEDNRKVFEQLNRLQPVPVTFFRIPIPEGPELDAWMMQPPDFDPGNRYPVLFFVYGEPGGQTVLDKWGRNRQLWHRMLAERGYVIVSIDNRGTPAPRGRAFHKCVYGEVGVLASADQAAAVNSLLNLYNWMDPNRIGIWGWSGGGSMTLNMLFRYPDLYRMGISVAPVSDQRYYDTIYQERYMGLPQENPDGYRKGSPIYHAEGLKAHLLLIHGTGDDNVHYQNTEALINRLVKLNKFFDLMIYPNRSHGLYEGDNMPRHLYERMMRYIMENLPLETGSAE